MDLFRMKATLMQQGVRFGAGLDEHELRRIEETHHFRFPPDLRDFLSYALPISRGFFDWRREGDIGIAERLAHPYRGICFDVEHNVFWPSDWGERPPKLEDAYAIVREKLAAAPKLVPIFAHRFIPDRPHEVGNPIFSVMQTDIIYYGSNLENYLERELSEQEPRYPIGKPLRWIELWTFMVERCGSDGLRASELESTYVLLDEIRNALGGKCYVSLTSARTLADMSPKLALDEESYRLVDCAAGQRELVRCLGEHADALVIRALDLVGQPASFYTNVDSRPGVIAIGSERSLCIWVPNPPLFS
jgi:hypothetical protein